METSEVWRVIDEQRLRVADLLDSLSPKEWETQSLCRAWRVRDVAAHLTLAQMGFATFLWEALRARFRFNAMIRDSALRAGRGPVEGHAPKLRAMVGSRRRAPFLTPSEPLIDILVHAQDMAIPLLRDFPMPRDGAAHAAQRVWQMGPPFHASKKFRGLRLEAIDADWSAGDGQVIRAPIAQLVLLLTGRGDAVPHLLVGPTP